MSVQTPCCAVHGMSELKNEHIIQAWAENRLSGEWLHIVQIKQGGICCDWTIVTRNWNVMLFVCVGRISSVLSPSGHLFRAFRAASDNCPWDNNRCSPLFFQTDGMFASVRSCNCCRDFCLCRQAMHVWDMRSCTILSDLARSHITRLTNPQSISCNR